ncbi:MAG TPA: alanine--tRNA ligase [Alphaproteobacteria bacterium]|jgi:alanyl-tRNA synthetase|nr:alanine--tRNA ligase [Alphaproteobacteria bacterium]
MITAADIRRTFLDFFVRNGHAAVPSSSLVPRNDPTLMFANSGMVQFKNVFTGAETRPYSRATTAQKCVRAGGKHNDLENVGYTARHHTFFEMLGNFSFGDYFKPDAIEFAWNLITKDFGLSPDRLTVTVYAEDDDAHALWRKIAGLPDSRIIRIPTADNFWRMGDTGPCGPCTEIFFDHGDKIPGGPPGSADQDGDRFIEIWNLVFMQYEQVTPDHRVDLPRPSIDTGMGLERLAAVLQGKHDNYDIDLMRALIVASADATGTDPDGPHMVSHRVIADHLRSTSFLLADGVMPSNEGRGYVLRRIMRRAMRHAHILGARDPLLARLVPALVKEMGQAYPELIRGEALITETLRLEERRFQATLDRGLKLLEDETGRLSDGGTLPGDVAFKLYDTYGFPLDLTADVLRGQGKTVDNAGFELAMAKQRADARRAWTGSGEAATEQLWFELRDRLGATEFLGYDTETAEGQVVAIIVDGQEVKSASVGQKALILTNQTPFYGESGGQVGDTGIVTGQKGKATVTDTQKKLGALFVHEATLDEGEIAVGDAVRLDVDHARRSAIRANHSATHLLHNALRRRLGTHIAQKGSLVSPERLRFDISQPVPIPDADLVAVEAAVNDRIRANAPVQTKLMSQEDAVASGAIAMFGEKYGDEVRVLSMGGTLPGEPFPYSVELCGGTHVANTGDIGVLKIVDQGAVSAGVRRIEALTGQAAIDYMRQREDWLDAAAAELRVPQADVPARVHSLMEERKKLEREVADLRKKLASGGGAGSGPEAVKLGDVQFLGVEAPGMAPGDLKSLVDEQKKKLGSGIAAVASASAEGKLGIVVGVTADLTGKFNAVDLVRIGSEAAGGKGGGGRPDMAQAGGPDGAKAGEALAAIRKAIEQSV